MFLLCNHRFFVDLFVFIFLNPHINDTIKHSPHKTSSKITKTVCFRYSSIQIETDNNFYVKTSIDLLKILPKKNQDLVCFAMHINIFILLLYFIIYFAQVLFNFSNFIINLSIFIWDSILVFTNIVNNILVFINDVINTQQIEKGMFINSQYITILYN